MKKSIVIIKPPARTNASAPYQYVNVWVQTAYEGFCAGYDAGYKKASRMFDPHRS